METVLSETVPFSYALEGEEEEDERIINWNDRVIRSYDSYCGILDHDSFRDKFSDGDVGRDSTENPDEAVEKEAETESKESAEEAEEEEAAEAYTIKVSATAYVADCEGCSGITKTGVDVRNTTHYEGKRVIAVDPSVIPLGTDVEVTLPNGDTFVATAQDIGGWIDGYEIDVLVADRETAIEFGRQQAEVRILD